MTCAPVSIDPDATLTATLGVLDCHVSTAVAAGYGRLFGAGGAFGMALTGVLTIYVALLGLGLITGRTRLTLAALTPKALALGLVLTFATAWPAYQTVVYGLLTGGPDQIASAFMGAGSGATQAFAARLDGLFNAALEAASAVSAVSKSPNLALATGLVWAGALILLLATLGLLVITRLVLAVLLALGPLFLVFALFDGSRGLFEGWLRTTVAFALAPMLVVLGGSGVVAVLTPLISVISDDPVRAVSELRPVVSLFLASVVYAALILTLMGVALALTRGWRVRPQTSLLHQATGAAIATAHAAAHGGVVAEQAAGPAGRTDRIADTAAAVLRESGRSADGRARTVAENLAGAALPAPATGPSARRIEGLGRTFRTTPERRAQSGKICA